MLAQSVAISPSGLWQLQFITSAGCLARGLVLKAWRGNFEMG